MDKIVRRRVDLINTLHSKHVCFCLSVKNAENSLYSGMYLDAKIINKSNEKLVKKYQEGLYLMKIKCSQSIEKIN